ncbi:triose-phosphate isomerase family protein [Agromyces archimandritae]|uniref:Triosephosphate isomerase n=1 Tax=Agromyces archimandritae TaxID=2781962 RepID=A0A975FN65_9MICO|nr:triose-phosphate isomerase family protein [Agromyces archimandritae]QTX04964.1 triosephosphate isomerase [Agromyces archimandritae]
MSDLRPTTAPNRPTLLGVSLKLYLDLDRSAAWARGVADVARRHPAVADGRVRLFALPSLPALPAVREALAGTRVELGAQDLSMHDRGAYTGEISGADLAAAGCRLVEVGHVERRLGFGEDEDTVRAKLQAAVRNGLTPVLCVGEHERVSPVDAAAASTAQLASALDGLRASEPAELIVAYEPVWAIGMPDPAPAEHIAEVVAALRHGLDGDRRFASVSVLYGGSAQHGSLSALGGIVDGLFLGRFAHDPAELARIVDEATTPGN